MYKVFTLSDDTGYFAREFDKGAPAPGVNWTGDSDEWLINAHAKGWITKTSPQDAKVGALIIGFQYPTGTWIGIVREVDNSTITYEALDNKGKPIRTVREFDSMKNELLGYILPENGIE